MVFSISFGLLILDECLDADFQRPASLAGLFALIPLLPADSYVLIFVSFLSLLFLTLEKNLAENRD